MSDGKPHKTPFLPPWIDRDDLNQTVALARIEAESTGFDPELAEREARVKFVGRESARSRREVPASVVFHEEDSRFTGVNAGLGWLDESRKVVSLSPPKRQTAGQRHRFLRNQLILAGTLAGFSQRQLAEIFDLPHSRIAAILDEMCERTGRDKAMLKS